MAASGRAKTPTHTGNISATTVAPDTPTSLASAAQSVDVTGAKDPTQLAPIVANTSLRDSISPKSVRAGLSPIAPPAILTGAAAVSEQRGMREKRKRSAAEDDSQQMSPNPGVAAVQTLLGNQMSTSKDAPPAVTKLSDPLERVAGSIKIPENNSHGPVQTSPISMSSLGSVDGTTAPTVTAMEATSAPQIADVAPPTGGTTPKVAYQQGSKGSTSPNDSGLRAFTFPPPLDQDPHITPQRGMSLPVPYNSHAHVTPSTRSPSISTGSGSSTKRHKCPYCSTDFTRHHNLKSHLLTHSQEKPYECKECNARFRRLHDLKRHTKLHTGERPHTCPKCGRKFARGDALARHNKGQGGCAGRRSSFGAPSLGDDPDGEGMDGLEYSAQQTEEPERMDDEDIDDGASRRRSEPSRDMQVHRAATASTYPPIQGGPASGLPRDAVRAMYPPPTGTAASPLYRDQSGPPPSHGGSSSGSHGPGPMHFPESARQVFAQAGMTESPKPLSPGQDGHRSSISGSGPYASYPRPGGSNQVSLQTHPPNSNAPTLPSLPGLSGHGPSSLHQSMPAPPLGSGSNPGSHSSHGQSSGGSLREVLGGSVQPGASTEIYGVMRELEVRMARMQEEYEGKINTLQQEVIMLREHVRVNQQPQPPAPAPHQPR